MKRIILALIMTGLLFVAACAPAPEVMEKPEVVEETTEEKIVMGAIFPLTGDAAAYGDPFSKQMMLAVDEINAAGGIDGKQVEIKLEDGKCNPKDAATAAQKLVNVDGVKVIFGGACSGEALGAAPITEAAEVILISPSATSPDITTAGDYVFRTAPSDAFAGKVAAEKALEMGFERAAIVHETTDYAQGLKRVFEETFEAGGGEVAVVESFATEDSDFRTQVLKVKNTNPDVIYVVPQTPAKGVLLIKQLREQGVEQQLMTGEVLLGSDVIMEHGKDMEGLIGVQPAFNEDGAIAKQALASYQAKHGEPAFPFFQAAMRDAVYLIAEGTEAHGDDTTAIRDWLYTVNGWEGAIGMLTIDENGDPVLDFSVKKVAGGELINVE